MLGFILSLLGCSSEVEKDSGLETVTDHPDATQIGDGGGDGGDCEGQASTAVADPSALTPLGFSAQEVLQVLEGERLVAPDWIHGDAVTLSISASAEVGELRYYEALEGCTSGLRVPFTLSVAAEDGWLSFRSDGELWVTAVPEAIGLSQSIADFEGDLDPLDYLAEGWGDGPEDGPQLLVNLQLTEGGSTGTIELLAYYPGDSASVFGPTIGTEAPGDPVLLVSW